MQTAAGLDKRMGAIFALLGFVIVAGLGLVHEGVFERVLLRALGAGLAGYVVGLMVGALAARLLSEAAPPLPKAEDFDDEGRGTEGKDKG